MRVRLLFCVLLVAARSSLATDYLVEDVLLTGEVAPGTGGQPFTAMADPVLNDSGDVAVAGAFNGSTGAFVVIAGTPSAVATTGDTAPDTGGDTFTVFSNVRFNQAGDVLFVADLTPSGRQGVFLYPAVGQPSAIALQGETTPSGSTFLIFMSGTSVHCCALNDSGQIAVKNFTTEIFVYTAGVGQLLVGALDAAPGLPGETFDSFSGPSINEAGDVAVPAITEFPNSTIGLWLYEESAQSLVWAAGDPAPGTGGGVFVDGIFLEQGSPIGLADSGQMAFTATALGGTADIGVFQVSAGGAISAVAVEGQVAPEIFEPFVFFSQPTINERGEVAFLGVTPTRSGIFVFANGALRAAVVHPSLAPGTGSLFFGFRPPWVNESGDVGFFGAYTGGGGSFVASYTPKIRTFPWEGYGAFASLLMAALAAAAWRGRAARRAGSSS